MIVRVAVALVASLGLATGATAPAASALLGDSGAVADPSAVCEGVRVVVDYNELGEKDRTGCVPPGTAAEAFAAADVPLEYAPQLQDFVCRVSGVPATGPCTDGTSYWSLWWSDGEAEWTYATLSVRSLEVPAGGAVGFAWHEGADDAAPPDSPVGGPAEGTDDPAAPDDAQDPDSEGTDGPEGPDGEDIVGEGDDSLPLWAVTVVAVIVLGGALVPLVRRRRS